MTKQEWIDLYILNFMATFDANHVFLSVAYGAEWTAGHVCEYKFAKKQAERAYKVFLKGAKK